MRLYYDSGTEYPIWNRVSGVIDFPDISLRNNIHSICQITLRDFEGGLFATWEPRDFTKMIITDDAGTTMLSDPKCNILFRGILTNKRFHSNDLILELSGLGIHLSRNSFGANEAINYIKAQGFVKTLNASSVIDLQQPDPDNPGQFIDFTWDVNQWVGADKDYGLIIKDTTSGYATTAWDAEDDLVVSGDEADETVTVVGDFSDTNDFRANEYTCKVNMDVAHPGWNPPGGTSVYITPTMEGVVIDSTAQFLKEIKIEWNYSHSLVNTGVFAMSTSSCELQIYNAAGVGTWEPIAESTLNKDGIGTWRSENNEGVDEANGGNGQSYKITGTDTELANYFTKVGDNYDHLTGLRFKLVGGYLNQTIDTYIKLNLDYILITVKYNNKDVVPLMHKITANGASSITCATVANWQNVGVTEDEDSFQVGENVRKILDDVSSSSGVTIDYTTANLQKYMARIFKGNYCIEPLKSICISEGAEWFEDHNRDCVTVRKKANFTDSGITLDQTDYEDDWEFEDQCNEYKYVYVWGKSSYNNVTQTTYNIFAQAISSTATGMRSHQIIDDNIATVPEAQDIADEQLALLESKRPSIRIPLNGVNYALQLGTYVNVTMARPTVGAADYKIRMIQRKKRGKTGVQTIVYCGFGETEWDEKIIKAINKNHAIGHKSLITHLSSNPYDVGVGGVTWVDIDGTTAGVETIIAADGTLFHVNIDGEINALTATVPQLVDKILFEESAGWVKKECTLTAIETLLDTATALHTDGDGEIQGLVNTVPQTVDVILFEDSTDGWAKKECTVNNLKAVVSANTLHDNVAGEITALVAAAANDGDDLLINDLSDGGNPKKMGVDTLGTHYKVGTALHTDVDGEIHDLANTIPQTVDVILFEDSTDGWAKKECTINNLKSMLGLLDSKKVIISAPFLPRTEQMFNGARLDLIVQGTDYIGVNFLVDSDMVDDTEDIEFIFVYRTLVTDGTYAMEMFRASIKTDSSENFAWNLDNATGFNMNVTANRINTETYTFTPAEYDPDDQLYSLLRLNDAAGDMYVEGCYITYYLK